MSALELLDIYDENLTPLGIKPRGEVHRDGDWHRVFHCWVMDRDAAGVDWLVMQKRAADKDTFPSMLDVSAAGHYRSGESITDGLREVQEELGITPRFADLIPVGRRMSAARYSGLIDREIADVFLLRHAADLATYAPDPVEVAGLVAFTIDDGLALFAGECDRITARARGLESPQVTLTRDDFLPRVDAYVYRVLITARQALNGERYLTV